MVIKRRTRNLKLGIIFLLIPLIGLGWAIWAIFGGGLSTQLAQQGAQRLETLNWQSADAAFTAAIPTYGQKFAYYRVKEKQTLEDIGKKFSVPTAKLAELNPGSIIFGTIIKIPPVEAALTAEEDTHTLRQTTVFEQDQLVHVKNDYKLPRVVTSIPELATFLKPYNVFQDLGNGVWRMNRGISLDENIRLDIVGSQVAQLQLRSAPNNDITCLCFENSEVLMKDTKVTTFDPATNGPDLTAGDGRSFIRGLKSTRMDVVGSVISYLGNELQPTESKAAIQKDGGTYGISWRIPDGTLGTEIATGWVEKSEFHHNHYGSYTFGASGMMWRGNHFYDNDIYGLDPHDDSNNAMVEDNLFEHNGKHGFIVSKRCNYNVIRNNRSVDNKLHGFMLHQDSVYNVMENNTSEGNVDNYVLYASDYNMIRNNVSIDAKGSHVRINEGSKNNFVMNNTFTGGRRGVYVYGNSENVYIKDNTFTNRREVLSTDGAVGVMFTDNSINSLEVKVGSGDQIIFGHNDIKQAAKKKTS